METVDTIIIGAGAAGLFCAIEAGKRGRNVIVLDHANKAGKKILMSGGGRCNFTNRFVTSDHYLSHNPHFCKSALGRYTSVDFITLVKKHHIAFHEKTAGQLFCDHKSQDIVDMLLRECAEAGVNIQLNTSVRRVEKRGDGTFALTTSMGILQTQSLVIATGGLSIPTLGATPFGYQIAEQFGIKLWPTRAGLVPLTLHLPDKEALSSLSGISVDSLVSSQKKSFRDNILFTHRGLSGPAILQISSYWKPGEALTINLLPNRDLLEILKIAKRQHPTKFLKTVMAEYLPKRVLEAFLPLTLAEVPLQSLTLQALAQVVSSIQAWIIKPNGTEGYRTAEVTLGGVDCDAISSKTFEANQCAGLYFIGEVLDVSGWLGGYNFQWAWASGWAAGQIV